MMKQAMELSKYDAAASKYDTETLRRFYVDERKGTREIGRLLGVSQPWAIKILEEHGIARRTIAENKTPTARGSKLRPEHAEAIRQSLIGLRKGVPNPNRSRRTDVPCEVCGKVTSKKDSYVKNHKHMFCGADCETAWRKKRVGWDHPRFTGGPVEVSCLQCGAKVFRSQLIVRTHERFFCCAKCKGAWFSANVTGDKIYNWRGGYEPYYGDSWKAARAKARSRDNHTCQRCGKTKAEIGKNLDVHHIVRFREFGPERHKEANALSNLITYCASCHKIVEEAKEKKDAK